MDISRFLSQNILPGVKLNVIGGSLPTEVKEIEIEYDENYRIKFKLTCNAESRDDVNRITASLLDDNRKSKKNSIFALAGGNLFIAVIRDYYIQEVSRQDNKVIAIGEVISINFRNRKSEETHHYNYWFINGDRHFPFNRFQTISSKKITNIRIGDNESIRLKDFRGPSMNRNHIQFKYSIWKIEICYSMSDDKLPIPITNIRFYGKKPPHQKVIEATASLYSFLCGKELLSNGYSFLNKNLIPTRTSHRNSIRSNLKEIIEKIHIYPIRIEFRRIDKSGIKIEELFESLLDVFVQKFDTLPIHEAIWLINQSHYLPLDIQMQPMATAFDLLKNAWYKNEAISKVSSYVEPAKYLELLGEEFTVMKQRLSTIPSGDKLISKIEGANSLSNNEKNLIFLKEIGLEFDLVENEVIRERNSVVHGSLKPKNYKKLSSRTLAFRTLLNRIILRLLSYSGDYIDYSWDNGSRMKFYALPIASPMQRDKAKKDI
ncbi:hypothetical protein [Leptospira licerasiae]|uniref:hypothetical protein n=1 Tax=Leptospira licerasiae TaxID=447106 RepID=UPI003016CE87